MTKVNIFVECEDVDENCGFWKEEGYCNQTEEFPQLQETCPLSCGVCKRCPAEEPTPPPCSQGIESWGFGNIKCLERPFIRTYLGYQKH